MSDASSSRARAARSPVAATLAAALWQHRGPATAAAAMMILARLAAVAIPIALKHVVDGLGHVPPQVFLPIVLALAYAGLRFLADALGEARDVAFSVVVQDAVASLRERTFAHLHRLGARFHGSRETGAIVRDVQKGADGVGFLLGTALFSVVPTAFEIAVVVAIMASRYDAAFVLVIGATFGCYAVYTAVFTRRRLVYQRAVNGLEADADSRLVDSLLNQDTVKYFSGARHEVARLRTVLDAWVRARLANQRALTTLHVGQSGIIAAGIAAVMLIAVHDVAARGMTVGDLILVNAYIIQVCAPLNTLGFVFREANDALVDVQRLFAILTVRGTPGEDEDSPGAVPLVVSAGEVAFRHVDFGYDPARLVLREVDFVAAPGRTLAIVGGSGSGKSTLIRLLFRFYRPLRGSVTIDGQDLATLAQDGIRGAIGIVPQDTVLFNDTIAYNIAYGQPDATRAEVVRAARAAQLDELIERLPDHYETRVGERGVRLSGGERQRIAIARALLKNPRIMVFDEATSALDTRSERAIQGELQQLARGRTTIVIAHRLSTVVDADRILVMDHGRIVEQGRHDDLLAHGGVYAKMWAMQWQQGDLEHAERRLVARPVQLAAFVARVAEQLRAAARRAGVTLGVGGVDGMGELSAVAVNAEALEQAVLALAANELGHAARGAHLELAVHRDANHVAVVVAGGGRPAPLDDALAARVEALVREAGAAFTLDPEGARVGYALVLPLHPVADADAAGRVRGLEGVRVLVIDDEEAQRDALDALLALHGASVRLAASGGAALAQLHECPPGAWPQVLLCDLMLAGEYGGDVLGAIRALEAELARPRAAALALTGYDRLAASGPGAGAPAFDGHLTKPVPGAALVESIRSVVPRA